MMKNVLLAGCDVSKPMIKLYDFPFSGNCYKVRLMLSILGLEYEKIPVDLKKGEQKSSAFLRLNPLGQVPVLTDGEVIIWDSQAILVYLARGYGGDDWLPSNAESMGKVLQWMSVSAQTIADSFAAARRHFLLQVPLDVAVAQQKAYQILQVMDDHLQQRQWLECDRLTIADIACFPYIGLAADSKVSLEAYPNVVTWIERIKQLPTYVGMPGL